MLKRNPCPKCGSNILENTLQTGVCYVEHKGCYKGPEVVLMGVYKDENKALEEAIRKWNDL